MVPPPIHNAPVAQHYHSKQYASSAVSQRYHSEQYVPPAVAKSYHSEQYVPSTIAQSYLSEQYVPSSAVSHHLYCSQGQGDDFLETPQLEFVDSKHDVGTRCVDLYQGDTQCSSCLHSQSQDVNHDISLPRVASSLRFGQHAWTENPARQTRPMAVETWTENSRRTRSMTVESDSPRPGSRSENPSQYGGDRSWHPMTRKRSYSTQSTLSDSGFSQKVEDANSWRHSSRYSFDSSCNNTLQHKNVRFTPEKPSTSRGVQTSILLADSVKCGRPLNMSTVEDVIGPSYGVNDVLRATVTKRSVNHHGVDDFSTRCSRVKRDIAVGPDSESMEWRSLIFDAKNSEESCSSSSSRNENDSRLANTGEHKSARSRHCSSNHSKNSKAQDLSVENETRNRERARKSSSRKERRQTDSETEGYNENVSRGNLKKSSPTRRLLKHTDCCGHSDCNHRENATKSRDRKVLEETDSDSENSGDTVSQRTDSDSDDYTEKAQVSHRERVKNSRNRKLSQRTDSESDGYSEKAQVSHRESGKTSRNRTGSDSDDFSEKVLVSPRENLKTSSGRRSKQTDAGRDRYNGKTMVSSNETLEKSSYRKV